MRSRTLWISIHALREEGDPTLLATSSHTTNFYPRPPRGGRRQCPCNTSGPPHFYPRPPRGGRQLIAAAADDKLVFLSTPSARRATPQAVRGHGGHQISIHALREEGDAGCHDRGKKRRISIHALREEGDADDPNAIEKLEEFLSTPSARRATETYPEATISRLFLSTPSARRATCHKEITAVNTRFLSTPSARRAT